MIKTFCCGFCKQIGKLACVKDSWQLRSFAAQCFLIALPEGYLLFDTGYPADYHAVMRRWPYILYKHLIPVQISARQTCLNQLQEQGIKADEIKYIFISHFHADHIGALRDFPQARFLASRKDYDSLQKLSSFMQLLKGFVKPLLPSDFAQRVLFIEELPPAACAPFPAGFRLPFSEELFAVPLPGHTKGQFGLWLPRCRTLLAADAAWKKENYIQQALPHKIAMWFCEDPKAFKQTLSLLSSLKDIHILLSHEAEACSTK